MEASILTFVLSASVYLYFTCLSGVFFVLSGWKHSSPRGVLARLQPVRQTAGEGWSQRPR